MPKYMCLTLLLRLAKLIVKIVSRVIKSEVSSQRVELSAVWGVNC